MAIERWDPFHELRSMRESMDRLLQEGWERRPGARLFEGMSPVDVAETDTTFVVRATIPGMRPEDIHVDAQGDRLTIRAEHQSAQDREDERYVVRERHMATFYRTLTLPAPVTSDRAEAHYAQGVLTLTLPKAAPSKSAQIPVRGDGETGGLLEPGSAPPKNA
jgi:HSP20 family protein